MNPRHNYFSVGSFLRNKFGEKVFRISLDAGFTCPNRDGSKGFGGCLYCGESGARARYVKPERSIKDQIKLGKEIIGKKYGTKLFIAYFQPYTNTYAGTDELYSIYKTAITEPDICGIAIGTRPDCIDQSKIDMLNQLSENTFVIVEYGAQSMKDETLDKIKRAHTAADTAKAIYMTKKSGHIHVVAHLIFGLPGETENDMVNSALVLAGLGVDGFKFHHLYVEKNTGFERFYKDNALILMERDQYIGLLLNLLPVIPPGIVIHRLFGECPNEKLLAPLWTLEKKKNIVILENLMAERGIRQGMDYKGNPCEENRHVPSPV
jgi:hypothetical protein